MSSKEGPQHDDHASPPSSRTRQKIGALVAHLPDLVLEQIFKYLNSTELYSCMLVCSHWSHVLNSECSIAWRSLAHRKLPSCALSDSHLLSKVNTYKMKLRALSFAWHPIGIDRDYCVCGDVFTAHRYGQICARGVRAKRGVSSGLHAFDIVWNGPLGVLAVVGVGTRNAYLRCLGHWGCGTADEQYWGWNLAKNRLLHANRRLRVYPRGKDFSTYKKGERIRLVIDCDRHVVYFRSASGTFLGTAFSNLPSVELYPTIWAGQRLANVSMVYIGHPH